MAKLHWIAALGALLALAGCAQKEPTAKAPAAVAKTTPAAPVSKPPDSAAVPAAMAIPADAQATAFGKGRIERADKKTATFKFDANFLPEGKVSGTVDYSMFVDGGKLDVSGVITCGHFDMEKNRAWLGGKIDINRSTAEAYQGKRYGTGQPIWFRFEESATHPSPPAKISELRFAGDDKFADADEFCSQRSWTAGGGGLHSISDEGAVIIFPLPNNGAN